MNWSMNFFLGRCDGWSLLREVNSDEELIISSSSSSKTSILVGITNCLEGVGAFFISSYSAFGAKGCCILGVGVIVVSIVFGVIVNLVILSF